MKRLIRASHISQNISHVTRPPHLHYAGRSRLQQIRSFHAALTGGLKEIKPFLLADIGEGIREVQIIQWFVQPGARVEEFDRLCEVQSDKASVEITSRFSGIIKRLHYDSDDMAMVGKPLVDIDIQGEVKPEDETLFSSDDTASSSRSGTIDEKSNHLVQSPSVLTQKRIQPHDKTSSKSELPKDKYQALATPAVRHLTKDLNVDITQVKGSGKEGRVLKEDVLSHVSTKEPVSRLSHMSSPTVMASSEDAPITLGPTQSAMFKAMTKSLTIPHFLYSDTVDMTQLSNLRQRLRGRDADSSTNISSLAFIVKAISQALIQFPILNARLEVAPDPAKLQLIYRNAHNFGIAVDTPTGLFVPVIHNVQTLSIQGIARRISELASLAREGRLSSGELSGGTFSVSNIGSIGGGVLSPIIVTGQVGIVGIGRARTVPSFDSKGNVVPREEMVLSWSADHRIVDGATVARCSEKVKELLEDPACMLVVLR